MGVGVPEGGDEEGEGGQVGEVVLIADRSSGGHVGVAVQVFRAVGVSGGESSDRQLEGQVSLQADVGLVDGG